MPLARSTRRSSAQTSHSMKESARTLRSWVATATSRGPGRGEEVRVHLDRGAGVPAAGLEGRGAHGDVGEAEQHAAVADPAGIDVAGVEKQRRRPATLAERGEADRSDLGIESLAADVPPRQVRIVLHPLPLHSGARIA